MQVPPDIVITTTVCCWMMLSSLHLQYLLLEKLLLIVTYGFWSLLEAIIPRQIESHDIIFAFVLGPLANDFSFNCMVEWKLIYKFWYALIWPVWFRDFSSSLFHDSFSYVVTKLFGNYHAVYKLDCSKLRMQLIHMAQLANLTPVMWLSIWIT